MLQPAIRVEQNAKEVKEGREEVDRPRGKVLLIDCVDEYTDGPSYFMGVGGVPFVAAVEILDHSDPKLTAMTYSTFDSELGTEMVKMPVPADVNAPSLGATLGANRFRSGLSEGKSVNKRPPAMVKNSCKS